MSEPVGITGTAVGLVSLGLQLYGEISKYVNAVKGRKDELDSAWRHAEMMQNCINAISDAIYSHRNANATTTEAVDNCVNSCTNELKALEAVVLSLKDPDAGADTLSSRIKHKGKQVAYPFHRERLLELEKRMISTNEVLQTALHAFGINISVATHDAVDSLQTHLETMDLTAEDTRGRISSMSDTIDKIHAFTDRSEQYLPEIHAQTTTTTAIVSRNAETLLQTTQAVIRVDENTSHTRQDVLQIARKIESIEEIIKGVFENEAEKNNVNRQIARLVAKPANLKTICDALLAPGVPGATASPISRREIAARGQYIQEKRYCICPIRKTRSRTRANWGPLSLDSDMRSTLHHSPECPLARIVPAEHSRNRVIGITVPAIQSLLRVATQVTFSMKTGAGGSNFDLGLKWIATVDPLTSPAFRIATIALDGILGIGYKLFMKDEQKRLLLESCWKRLFLCYAENRASPADVDPYGMSLLNWLTHETDYVYGLEKIGLFVRLINSLLPLKIPANTCARFGKTTLAALLTLDELKPCDTVFETIKALESSGAEIDGGRGFRVGSRSSSKAVNLIQFVKSYPQMAEVLGFGPLATAIIREDHVAINQLLKVNPASVNQISSSGHFSIHIAVAAGNVDILRSVLTYAAPVNVNVQDNDGFRPIDYATCERMHTSYKNHRPKKPEVCNGCVILDLILSAGCALYPGSLGLALEMGNWGLQDPSIIVQQKVIREVSIRRQGLAKLAMSVLSRQEMDFLDLSETRMLDHNAGLVQHHLQMRSCVVPESLKVWDEEEEHQPAAKSIYALISNRHSAEFAWRLGFDSIWSVSDVVDQASFDLQIDAVPRDISVGIQMAQYISWWLDKIHDASRPSEQISKPIIQDENSWSVMHIFMRFLGKNREYSDKLGFNLSTSLSDAIFRQRHVDNCSCYCSLEGCTPLTMFLDASMPRNYDPSDLVYENRFRRSICQKVFGLIPLHRYRSEGYEWIYRAILRYLTFEALGIRHTCCLSRASSSRGGLSYGEVEEIQKEDGDLLTLMEDLVADFEERCKCNARLIPFLKDNWAPRMRSVFEELETNKFEELQAAEKIGVRWEHQDSEARSRKFVDKNLAYWMEKLDEIVPEPDMVLPPGVKF